ncbi:hypothetical protein [Flammeovirga sp. SJP92]|uniref:hypothetical protein n=1 Tax=Flammeovirga sp. SJP92 TaxID=1775430 RepID=UPI00078893B6|nr:hypothetical protein [Flammeovirga sp. SJP92]KXX71242.1 hypothetical protein AVL50_09300 [Flammeovirga sp. SJP92]
MKPLFFLILVLSAFKTIAQVTELGNASGHAYVFVNGNTDNFSESKIRITKYSNANAHIDVWDGNDLHFNYYKGNHIFFGNGSGSAHSMFAKEGRLMINTLSNNSNYNLFVNGNSYVNGVLVIPSANDKEGKSSGITCQINDDFLFDEEYIHHYGFGFHNFDAGSSANGNNAYMSGHFGADIFTGGKHRFRITQHGKVGIGTTTPDAMLAVNGNIKAKEVKVTNENWPDYVFEDSYALKPLSEVEAHIKKYKHLPDVPSAKEIEEDGVNLGESDAVLLRKVEELTLYLIEVRKELDKQNELNKIYLERIKKLEQD